MTAWHDPRRLTGMTAPLAVWALHFVVVYSLQGLVCGRAWRQATLAGQPMVFWAWLLLTVFALAAVAWCGLRARRCLSAASGSAGGADGRREGRFASRLTLLVSGMAFVAVVFTAVPVFMLAPCE